MTKKELIVALLERGVVADPKMLKTELEALLEASLAPAGPFYIPSWCLDERRTKLPDRISRERVVLTKPGKRPPPLGGSWVRVDTLPKWLK